MTSVQPATPGPVPVDPWVLGDVAYGTYHSPHSVLGGHLADDGVTIRTVQHLADDVQIRTLDGLLPATHEQELAIPAGTPCERQGRTLRVEQGGARGAGGMFAPTHAALTVLLSEGPRLVRVDAQLYPQR